MKIHEYQAIDFFKKAGLPVCDGEVATEVNKAKEIAKRIGYPVVLKSQVLVGGRGKAGGIKVVKDEAQLVSTFEQLRKLVIKGYPVERIFVVKAINIKKEFYCAVTIDPSHNDIVLIASAAGGVDIEETAQTHPEQIQKYYLQGKRTFEPSRWVEFIKKVFPDGGSQAIGTDIFNKLVKIFFENDCSLVEVNPLVIDDQGKWYAADAKINLDDNALFRHPDAVALRDLRYEDPDELEAKECQLSFVKLDGNVGCIVNGAGLAMATVDVTNLLGGQPANFLDVGGSSSPEKVLNALRIILKNPKVKSILINIFGGITRCDDIANGILQAREQLKIKVPLFVRLTGTNEKEAKEILAKAGIGTFQTMRQVVQEAVAAAK
jgi:succinyl-CoA synthetase beta subunit